MIVLLTDEALLTLNFFRKLDLEIQGFLMGHLRGNGIIVEKAISIGPNLPTPEQILKANKLLENKLIGFFNFNSKENSLIKFLNPVYAGNVILKAGKNNKELQAFLIDFQKNKMVFSPLKLEIL